MAPKTLSSFLSPFTSTTTNSLDAAKLILKQTKSNRLKQTKPPPKPETYALKKKHHQVICGRCKLLSHGHMITSVEGSSCCLSAKVPERREWNTIVEAKQWRRLFSGNFSPCYSRSWRIKTCSYDQWTTLQSSFGVGAGGSKIIMTTGDANVAKMMGDPNPYNLNAMSQDDCWKIFKHRALLNSRAEDAEFLKEKIVDKCNGIPLAAKTLGGLLRCKKLDEWGNILDHKIVRVSEIAKKSLKKA